MLELGPARPPAGSAIASSDSSLSSSTRPAAARLAHEFAGSNVTVEVGDCTCAPYRDASFDAVGAFTMLHHLPRQALQFATPCVAFRLLRPGGVLLGADSLASQELHAFHEGDFYNPIDPARLVVFLQAAGFARVTLTVDQGLLFTAHKPLEGDR